MLATEAARGRISGLPTTTANSITFDVDDASISGLYLPPSLAFDEVKAELEAVGRSTVVLGDFNVRFP